MNFNYKTNFICDKERRKYIRKVMIKGKFYKNEDGVIVSKEYPKNEGRDQDVKFFSYEKDFRDKKRDYYIPMLNLCDKYYPIATRIIEVGAGTGYFSNKYIKKFKPKRYIFYENSKAMVSKIKKRMRVQKFTKTHIYNESFRNRKELKKYDCVIALEVLEHVGWDKEFLSLVAPLTWVFFSVPRLHAFNHVRAFLTPDSIAYRYKDILDICEIREVKRKIHFKSRHNYPIHWVVAARKK